MLLEPRIMYDGAAAATATHHHHHHDGGATGDHPNATAEENFLAARASGTGAANAGQSQQNNVSANNGQWQSQSSEPMPQVAKWVKNPTEIVFIDTQVSDYQALVAGVSPGVEVVLLNSNSDGLQQIADFLASHPDPNLTTIAIVGHGASGELNIGSTTLTDANLSGEQSYLTAIGQALQVGGQIDLYACDTASGAAGVAFIGEFSQLTGAAVAASDQDIGATASGDNWALDVTAGGATAVSAAGAPFSATTEADFTGTLSLPTVTPGSPSVTFDTGESGVTVDAGLTVSDSSHTTLASATVSITSGFLSGDTLSFVNNSATNFGNITSSYNSLTGVLTLTSAGDTATVQQFQNALDAVIYSFAGASGDPTNGGADTSRTISWVVNDGTNSSTAVTSNVTVANQAWLLFEDANGDLWATNGTTATDISAGWGFGAAYVYQGSSANSEAAVVGSIAYFVMYDSANQTYEIWAWNGTTATQITSSSYYVNSQGDAQDVSNTADSEPLQAYGNELVFSEQTLASYNNGTSQPTFAVYNPATNQITQPATPNGGYNPQDFVTLNGILYFEATDDTTNALAIYSYNGTSVTELYNATPTFQDPNTSPHTQAAAGWVYPGLIAFNGNIYFDSGQESLYELNLSSTTATNLATNVSGSSSNAGNAVHDDTGDSGLYVSGNYLYFENYFGGVFSLDTSGNVHSLESTIIGYAPFTLDGTTYFTGPYRNYNASDPFNIYSTNGVTATSVDTDASVYFPIMFDDTAYTYGSTTAFTTFNGTSVSNLNYANFPAGDTAFPVLVVPFTPVTWNTSTVTTPVVTAGNTVDYFQGEAATPLDGSITVTDSNQITGATVTIANAGGAFVSGDTLGIPAGDLTSGKITGTNITESYDSTTGVLTLSGTDSAADYQTALRDVTYSFSGDPTVAGADPTRTVTWSVQDANGTGTATTTIDALATPVLAAGTGYSAPAMSTSGALAADSQLTLTDGNSFGSAPVATVSISGGALSGDALLIAAADLTGSVVDGTGGTITLSGNDSTTLTLTGTSSTTAAEFQAALRDVEFNTTAANSKNGTRTLSWTFNDDATGSTTINSSNTLTTQVAVEFPPTIGATGNTVAYYQGQASPAALDGSITVTDPNVSITGATVTITSNYVSGDTLNFTTQNGISEQSYSNGVLTLTGTASAADYQAALQSITYSFSGDPTNAGADKTRTVTWSVTDANGQTSATGSTTTLDVYATPVVSVGNAPTPTYTGVSGAVTADSTLSVTDNNGTTLAGATVTISSGGQAGDALTINGTANGTLDGGKISYAFSGSTLTLSGSDSVAEYITALDAVQFTTTSTTSGTRTLSWQVNDEAGGQTNDSAAVTTSVSASFGPAITAGNTADYYMGQASPVTLDGSIVVSDPSASVTGATVTITNASSAFVSGDTLGIPSADLTGTTITGTNITESYDSATGVLTLSGTDTAANYQIAMREVTYSFSGDPTVAGADPTRTITWSITDTASQSTSATTTLDAFVTPVLATGTGYSAPVMTASGALTADADLAVTDTNTSGTAPVATVAITAGYLSGDTLSFHGGTADTFGDGGIITGVFNASTHTLTLSSSNGASAADFQSALEAVTFNTTASNSQDGTRTLSWSFNDDAGGNANTSNTVTTNVDVEFPPTIGATGNTVAYYQGQTSPTALDGSITVTDPNVSITGATVTITSNYVSGDTLNFTTQNGISEQSYSNGVLTLTGTASAADYQAALQSITYSFSGDPTNAGADPTRTITWSVTDANGETSATGATTTLDVYALPVVSAGNATTPLVTSTSGPVIADSTLSVTDDNGATLAGATVIISSGFQTGDTLSDNGVSNGGIVLGNITATYNSSTHTLTLSGTDSVAHYITALDEVEFNAVSPNNGTRTLSWQVNDEAGGQTNDSTAVSTNVDVAFGPVIGATGNTVTFDQGGSPVAIDSTITVTDPSGANITGATVTLTGTFSTTDALADNGISNGGVVLGNITASYDGTTHVLTLSGSDTAADYQTALREVTYSFSGDPTNSGANPTRTVTWSVTDAGGQGNTGSPTSTIDVVGLPVIGSTGNTVTFNQGGSPAAIDNAITLADPNGVDITGATVTLTGTYSTGDALADNGVSNGGNVLGNITASYNSTTHVLTLSGNDTAADYQTALREVTYSFSGDPTNSGANLSRTVTWSVSDADSVSSAAGATSTVDVTHTAPAVTAGATVTYTQGGAPVALDGALAVTDVIASGNLTGATVTITSNYVSGDTLNFTTQNGISEQSYSNGVLKLTGVATVAQYQSALESITFSSSSVNPTNDGASISRTISWSVTDADSSNGTSATATSSLNIQAVPTVVAGVTVNYQAGLAPTALIDKSVGVYDSVNLTSVTVSITSGLATGDTLSANTAGTPIQASYNAGVLTLTGNATPQQYDAVLQSVTYSSTRTASGTLTITWQATDQNNAQSAPATSQINVVGVFGPPVPSGSNGGTGTPGGFSGAGTPGPLFQPVSSGPGGPPTSSTGSGGADNLVSSLFGFHSVVTSMHYDVQASVAADGAVTFTIPLGQIAAALDGDVVSLEAKLPDGQPLPEWLHFDADNGTFAGSLPKGLVTGSLPTDDGGGFKRDTMTIDVVARDSKGDTVITKVTIDLTGGKPHTWNVPAHIPATRLALPPSALPERHGHAAADATDTHHHAAAHERAAEQAPAIRVDHGARDLLAGRAGLSARLDGMGWRAMHADRAALLDSLRHAARGGHA